MIISKFKSSKNVLILAWDFQVMFLGMKEKCYVTTYGWELSSKNQLS